jgi:hypothetical protein
MIALIVFLVVYVVSGIGAYRSVRKNYLSGGEWHMTSPTLIDVFAVLMPGINIFVCFIGIINYLIETDARSFFRLDK